MGNHSKNFKIIEILTIVFLLFIISFFILNSNHVSSDDGNILFPSKQLLNDNTSGITELLPLIQLYEYSLLYTFNLPFSIIQGFSSIGLVLIIYLFIKNYFNRKVALISLLLFFLSPIFLERSWLLSPYAEYLFFIMLSLFLFYKGLHNNDYKYICFGAIIAGLSVYVFNFAIIFLPLFSILYIFKGKLKPFLIFYLILSLLALPWLIYHIIIAGIHNFYYSPFNWYVVKYLPIVNVKFWGHTREYGLVFFKQFIMILYQKLFNPSLWVFIPLGFIFLIKKEKKLMCLFLSFLLLSCLPFIILRVAPFSRYLYSAIVPLLVFIIAGIFYILRFPNKLLKVTLIFFLVVLTFSSLGKEIEDFKFINRGESIILKDANLFLSKIDNNKNILLRHKAFQSLYDNTFYSFSDLKEEEVITYLMWNDEKEVKNILNNNNIGWIILYNDVNKWENEYYVWFKEKEGISPNHYKMMDKSKIVHKIVKGGVYTLYKVD